MIFAAIAIAWLAYLVPHFVRRRDDDEQLEDSDPADRFSDSMRIVRHGTAPLLDQDLEEIASFEVSTPQTRRAAVKDLRRLEVLAALRRRRVLLVLMAALSAVIGLCAAHLIPWWSTAIPGGLLLIFIVVARISVRVMLRRLDASLSRNPPRRQRVDHLSQQTGLRQERDSDGPRGWHGRRGDETWDSVGSHPDHHADLRFQAAGAADGSHHRLVGPGNAVFGTA